MKNKILVPEVIITADRQDNILRNHAVEISEGKIKRIFPFVDDDSKREGVEYLHNLVMVPGFIQSHVHLCQTLFRGLADDMELLDWLQYRIFPYENAHNADSLRASVRIGLYEILKSGTTTILDMGTLRHQEIIFDELISSGIRAFAGKCMMDRNELFPSFKSATEDELNNTYQLAGEYHNKSDKIKYGFAPRFVLSSSEGLLKETAEMMKDFEGSIYHTHSSENRNECSTVRDMFGCDNVEYFERIGVLGKNTVLAHCVHLNEIEKDIIALRKVSVAHCPSSNLKLGSGYAEVPDLLKRGITVSLGADGAPCNNNMSIFKEMHLASLIHKPKFGPSAMDARKVFRMATIEGAKALGMEESIGSIEEGKKADLLLLDLNNYMNSLSEDDEKYYSDIVYSAGPEAVKNVMVGGEWLMKNEEISRYDEKELIKEGEKELKKLLRRI